MPGGVEQGQGPGTGIAGPEASRVPVAPERTPLTHDPTHPHQDYYDDYVYGYNYDYDYDYYYDYDYIYYDSGPGLCQSP